MKGTRGLGRGLGAILPVEEEVIQKSHVVEEIPVETIEPNPYQPRLDFGEAELEELTESIRQHGLIQPITLRQVGSKYQIISGERRWRAAMRAGLLTVPAYVRSADNTQLLTFALVENVQRQDLNPIELALAYKRMIEECGLTQEEVARAVGRSRATVANTLRLLRLSPAIQKALKEGTLTEGHARPLLSIDNPEMQLALFHRIIEEGLSVREVEGLVNQLLQPPSSTSEKTRTAPPSPLEAQLKALEGELMHTLHAQVRITPRRDGSGEIRIRYLSGEDLERLLDKLRSA
jgi:ParB family chromosome partitioning protein